MVVGDSILDEFRDGTASRVSPESPVLVLDNPVSTRSLGGALNAFHNVVGLGQKGELRSLIGDDDAGNEILTGFTSVLKPEYFFVDRDYKTPHKIRYSSHGHQLLRVDYESKGSFLGSNPSQHPILSWIEAVDESMTVGSILVISDYCKGALPDYVCRRLMTKFKASTILVDSKNREMSLFSGAAMVTPNLSEGKFATGETEPHEIVKALQKMTGGNVLLTLGAEGMLFLSKEGEIHTIEAKVQEITDVTGAGDTVIAAIAVALSEGASTLEAVRWSALAASNAVSHLGTHAVSRTAINDWR